MKTELNVCKELKRWFNRFGVKCWLNQGDHKFTTKLSQKKPDIIIYSVQLDQYITIEVKPGGDRNAIRDGVKIIDYWQDYVNNKIKYYIDEQEIKISSFCFATLGAMNGKIFLDDDEPRDSYNDTQTKWKQTQLKFKLEPRWEYPKSKEYLRLLWANWKRIRKKEYQPGVGVILANVLNCPTMDVQYLDITQPLLFDMQWRMSFRNKEQWRQKNFIL